MNNAEPTIPFKTICSGLAASRNEAMSVLMPLGHTNFLKLWTKNRNFEFISIGKVTLATGGLGVRITKTPWE